MPDPSVSLVPMLHLAVPIWQQQTRGWTDDQRIERSRVCGQAVAEHGDDLMYGGPRCAETFNRLAEGLAIMADGTGGATVFGFHWHRDTIMESPDLYPAGCPACRG